MNILDNLITDTLDTLDTMKTDSKPILDLTETANDLLLNDAILNKLATSGEAIIKAKQLLKSFPLLEPLGDMSIYKVHKSRGINKVLMPSINLYDGELVVTLPDHNATVSKELTIYSIHLSLDNECYCLLESPKAILKCYLSLDMDSLILYADSENIELGDFTLESLPIEFWEFFKSRPKLLTKLSKLELGKRYKITALNGVEDTHNTPLMSVEGVTGKDLIENLITNAELQKFGKVGRIFSVQKVESFKDANGKPKEKCIIKWEDRKSLIIS